MLELTTEALTSLLLMSSPTGSLPKQPIIKKNVPQARSTPIIQYPRIEPADSDVIRNMNEQNMSKMPRPFVVLRNRKFLRIKSKSQNEITMRNPKKL